MSHHYSHLDDVEGGREDLTTEETAPSEPWQEHTAEADEGELRRNDEGDGADRERLLPHSPELPQVVQHVMSEELPTDVTLTIAGEAEETTQDAPEADKKVSLPWRILIIIYGVLVGDAIASTVITPFVPGTPAAQFLTNSTAPS